VGGGLGGLAALAALVLLFLFKKKKKRPEPSTQETTETVTLTEEATYISEYGMSDGVQPPGDGDGEFGDDIPRQVDGSEDDDLSGASEHNPDEFKNGMDEFI
jgi:hypothetical protein